MANVFQKKCLPWKPAVSILGSIALKLVETWIHRSQKIRGTGDQYTPVIEWNLWQNARLRKTFRSFHGDVFLVFSCWSLDLPSRSGIDRLVNWPICRCEIHRVSPPSTSTLKLQVLCWYETHCDFLWGLWKNEQLQHSHPRQQWKKKLGKNQK